MFNLAVMVLTTAKSTTMVDGIKLSAGINNAEQWKVQVAGGGLYFTMPVCTQTGQIKEREHLHSTTRKEWAEWCGYRLELTTATPKDGSPSRCRLELKGSLHKSHHGGRNFEPFTFPQLLKEIDRIERGLHLPADCWKIDNIEVGVNICPPFSKPADFIDRHLLMHGPKEFFPYLPAGGKQIGKHSKGDKFFLKVYDKGLQYDLPADLLRIELRFIKMAPLKTYGINTLESLRSLSHLEALLRPLLAAWDKVLLTEPLAPSLLKKRPLKERKFLRSAEHLQYWKDLHKINPQNFRDNRKKWNRLRRLLGGNVKEQTHALISSEWHRLACRQGEIITP